MLALAGLPALALVSFALPPSADPVGAEPARRLEIGATVHDHLGDGALHRWRFDAVAGRPLRLVARFAAHAADLRLRDPAGQPALEAHLPWGLELPLVLAPTTSGPYTVELASAERGAPPGGYSLRLDPAFVVAAERLPAERALGAALRRFGSDDPADSRVAAEALESARALFAALDSTARAPLDEAITLELLAEMRGRLGDRDAEVATLHRALEIVRASPADARRAIEGRLLGDLGLALLRVGRLDDASSALAASLDAWRRVPAAVPVGTSQAGERRTRTNLGLLHLRRGDWPAARERFTKLLEELAGSDERRLETRILTSLGGVHANLGETAEALAVYRRALDGAVALGDTAAEARLHNNLGALQRRRGEPEEALEHYRRALEIFRAEHDLYWLARTENNLGFTLLGLGDLDAASERFVASLRLRREVGDRRGEAVTVRNLGRAAELRGDLVAAREHHREALEIARELGDRRAEADAFVLLGRVRRRLGDSGGADQLREALVIYRDLDDRLGVAVALRELAEASLAHGRPGEARAFLDEALPIHRRVLDPVAEMETLYALARVERASGRDEAARERLEEALALVETLRERIADPLDRATFLAARGDAYALLVDLLADRPAEALGVAERARARVLLDLLGTPDGVPPALDGAAIPALLDPSTVLLEIALGEARSRLFVVRSTGVESHVLPGRRRLEALARATHESFSRVELGARDPSPVNEAFELSRLLLGPLGDALASGSGLERLALVADGALHAVPIAALPLPEESLPEEPATLVVERFEVVHLPSASALAAQRALLGAKPARATLAVFADPIFDADDPRWSATRPAAPSSGESLGRLPRTREEALAIAELLSGDRAFVALGTDARRDLLLDGTLAPFRVLHFATHGLLDPRRPERSGLVLSRFDSEGRPIEGFLRLEDLLDLDLEADLVVLSGCRTALGREVRGEGLVGLAAGFAYAGVPRVVASLWQVQDQATAELMTRFYRAHLVEGRSPAAALAEAQRSIRLEPRWRDPFYWAAFVHQGPW